MPSGIASQTPTCEALWWWLSKVANMRPPTQKVGSPCETFSPVPGSARQMARSRASGATLSRA